MLLRLGSRSFLRSGIQPISYLSRNSIPSARPILHRTPIFRLSSRTLVTLSREKLYSQFIFLVIVKHQSNVVLERFGKFSRVLQPGLHFIIPGIDHIAYGHSLKEEALSIPNQTAITNDNVSLNVDGVLYVKIMDPKAASYGTSNLVYSITQLAQTTMRSELGKITLDKTFAEREALNANIVEQINRASEAWGILCLRYEIRDISPPPSVKNAMDMQAEAERRKRATILTSEGERQSQINIAQAHKRAAILQARGEAQATVARAKATARGVKLVARALRKPGGKEAVSLRVAEQYVKAWSKIAQRGTTILLPSETNNPSASIASAFAIFNKVVQDRERQFPSEKEKDLEVVKGHEVFPIDKVKTGKELDSEEDRNIT